MEVCGEAVGAMQAYLRLKRYILPSGIAREALTAAIPHLPGVGVKKLEWTGSAFLAEHIAHTPGPWLVGPFDMIWPASDVELRDGKWHEKVAEPRIIASTSKGNLQPHEDRANAYLMAASPDLYEVVHEVLNHPSVHLPVKLEETIRTTLSKALTPTTGGSDADA